MMTPDLMSNKSALIWGFTEGTLEKDIIDDFYKTFVEIFPGIEVCLKNYDIVCNMTEDMMKTIVENIAEKIRNSGHKDDIGAFLGQLTFILTFTITINHKFCYQL